MGQAREVMDRITEAMMRGDTEAIAELYAPDAVAEAPGRGTINGREEIAAYYGELNTAFPDASYEPFEKYEMGASAIDEGYYIGTHTGPMPGPDGETIEPTGKYVRARGCDIATLDENGLVKTHRMYWDNLDFLAQLGLLPDA